MIRNIEARLKDIEARIAPKAVKPWRRVIGNSAEECDALVESLIAAGHTVATDKFICRVMVAP